MTDKLEDISKELEKKMQINKKKLDDLNEEISKINKINEDVSLELEK